ncbi:MAG: DUF4215 domain-containing protein [Polyangiaceae bacterium]|nr:DUF4215 domain-containing protein [Polyangiaceae bacterium]
MLARFAWISTALVLAACAEGMASSEDEPVDTSGSSGEAGASGLAGAGGAGGGAGGIAGGPAGAAGKAGAPASGSAGVAGQAGSPQKAGGAGGATATPCGNGKLDAGEPCDGADLGGETCATATGKPGMVGELTCTAACAIDTSGCTAGLSCGDGVANQASEDCDGGDLRKKTCADALSNAAAQGALACTAQCKLDASGCSIGPACGDQKKDPNEECDAKDLGGATCASALNDPDMQGTLSCTPGCKLDESKCVKNPKCGDGAKNQASEQCDGADLGQATCKSLLSDVNATGTPKCTAACAYDLGDCSVPAYCGDKKKAASEACDGADFGGATCASVLGPGHGGALGCGSDCKIQTANCVVVAACGDGTKNQASEQCDGADHGGATCSSIVGQGSQGQLTCNADCTLNASACTASAFCGNGKVDAGESCDGADFGGKTCATVLGDSKATGSLSCSSCALVSSGCSIPPYCGDGKLAAGEECDDGNVAGGDGCSATCVAECLPGELKLGTHCYGEYADTSGNPTSWDGAKAACEGMGRHLVTITSSAEADLVWDEMSGVTTQGRWIGYTDRAVEGTWSWITGEASGGFIPPWDSGEPNDAGGNEDCAEFLYSYRLWNDNSCSRALYFWCEAEPIVKFP